MDSKGKMITELKLFTVEEANRLLPLVRPKLEKIRDHHQKLQKNSVSAMAAARSAEFGGGGMKGGSGYAKNIIELSRLTTELTNMGVQLKDFSRGLIDFPHSLNGKIVLLCWQLGEEEKIEWWHDLDAGFRGRTRL